MCFVGVAKAEAMSESVREMESKQELTEAIETSRQYFIQLLQRRQFRCE